jgi:hypothetical protein
MSWWSCSSSGYSKSSSPPRGVFGLAIGLVVLAMMLTPFLGRLIANEADQQTRMVLLEVSALIMMVADTILLPVCNLNARCIDIWPAVPAERPPGGPVARQPASRRRLRS